MLIFISQDNNIIAIAVYFFIDLNIIQIIT